MSYFEPTCSLISKKSDFFDQLFTTSNQKDINHICLYSIEAKAITLLQNKCFACHGPANSIGVSQINNATYLISIGQIIPGNPSGSPLFNAVSTGSMPIQI